MRRTPIRGRARTFSLALVLVFGGCMVGPDYEPPEAEVNTEWIEATGGEFQFYIESV